MGLLIIVIVLSCTFTVVDILITKKLYEEEIEADDPLKTCFDKYILATEPILIFIFLGVGFSLYYVVPA